MKKKHGSGGGNFLVDPQSGTPETEYNELMAEYYRRIDYALRIFQRPQP